MHAVQPIELRVQELVAGVRSDVGLSLYGDDLGVLKVEGDKIVRALNKVPGAADARATVEREVKLPPGYVLEWGGRSGTSSGRATGS